ncbi:hypothetical protein GCM10009678_86510 [Actinomadura kijaniata]|uniref:Uncharacterized protein n=1 Tax=Actinomadura namibiensis TaxID=182080 RepID=A0A7W3QSK9_ACTNM|nr:hypothetical protein [Actinomadura namibiensis]MBA8957732.1 hypothetical protein [Actinomadura namibiensis]
MTGAVPPSPVAVLGIDPGRKWTAGVLRVGARALHGWTLGPVDAGGAPDAAAVDNVHDVAAFARYAARILDAVEETVAAAPGLGAAGRVWLACEIVLPPTGRNSRIALADWLIPRQMLAAIVAHDPRTVLVPLAEHGKRRPLTEHYPAEFWPAKGRTGGRPASWGPCEARRGERDHERAAFDVAGAAARLLAHGAGAASGAGQ